MFAQDQTPFFATGDKGSPADDLVFSIKLYPYISIFQLEEKPIHPVDCFHVNQPKIHLQQTTENITIQCLSISVQPTLDQFGWMGSWRHLYVHWLFQLWAEAGIVRFGYQQTSWLSAAFIYSCVCYKYHFNMMRSPTVCFYYTGDKPTNLGYNKSQDSIPHCHANKQPDKENNRPDSGAIHLTIYNCTKGKYTWPLPHIKCTHSWM